MTALHATSTLAPHGEASIAWPDERHSEIMSRIEALGRKPVYEVIRLASKAGCHKQGQRHCDRPHNLIHEKQDRMFNLLQNDDAALNIAFACNIKGIRHNGNNLVTAGLVNIDAFDAKGVFHLCQASSHS